MLLKPDNHKNVLPIARGIVTTLKFCRQKYPMSSVTIVRPCLGYPRVMGLLCLTATTKKGYRVVVLVVLRTHTPNFDSGAIGATILTKQYFFPPVGISWLALLNFFGQLMFQFDNYLICVGKYNKPTLVI